jgi:L-fucose isomerase-like protein
VRFSEKLLENAGISVETLDLSEVFGRIELLADDDPKVVEKLSQINDYVPTKGIPEDSLVKMAKLGVVVDAWMTDNELIASAFQCWTSLEEYFGVVADCFCIPMLDIIGRIFRCCALYYYEHDEQ